jgi:hypothetical protein
MAVHGAGTVGKSIANACINADRLSTTMRSQSSRGSGGSDLTVQIGKVIGRYPRERYQCGQCAKELYKVFKSAKKNPKIFRIEVSDRRMKISTKDGKPLSDSIPAYHEFVEVDGIVYDTLTGENGLARKAYEGLFYPGVFDDGSLIIRELQPP